MCGQHDGALTGPRASGASRSEIKEEPRPRRGAGDIRGGKYPVASARALKLSLLRAPKLHTPLTQLRVANSAMVN